MKAPNNAESRREIFLESMAKHGVNRCVLVSGSFRAGTSFVCSLLGKNGMAGIRTERFSKLAQFVKKYDQHAFADQMDQIFSTTTDGLFVAKIMWPHRNALALNLGCDRAASNALASIFPNAHWINVIRKDKIEQAISYWKAKETKVWQRLREEEEVAEPEYNFSQIYACLIELSVHDMSWADFHNQAETQVVNIVYEDFLSRVEVDLPPILEWLNQHRLPTQTMQISSPLKQQRNSHSEDVKNRFLSDLYSRLV